ncbi:hypothetical protein DEU56DRAFT_742428 [Suillus clintonianus]|uniref:uncharacterized protein n=1 Tax=Suillus clintonianus TaxID=1904413 RepID=UPI001B868DEF|nr:uncharacterized protein DEU56DRAFT_742428 [Suillus clintonianus]KAG2127203.1 hypothetical protein DEU56DRAFT_742428 [Suillus clintonianus]
MFGSYLFTVPHQSDTGYSAQYISQLKSSTSLTAWLNDGRGKMMSNAALQEGFVELERVINDLARNTSIPSPQIISLWNKSHARTVNNVNHWNAYTNYFKNNLKQELSRLGDKAPEAPSTPSDVRRKCYDAFKKSFPNDWQDILEIYGETALFLGGPQTVSTRGQEFQKFTKKLSGLMDTGAARFGFEAALVACGKVVNQDGSLGMAHTTSGAGDVSVF